LFVTDTANSIIRRVSLAGVVTTVAGSAGMSGSADGSVFAARFFGPIGLGVDAGGDIYISDTVNDTVRNADGDLIGSNDNWKSIQQSEIEAIGLAPKNDAEAALLEDLPPGSYTVIVAGKDGGTGVGLVEIYSIE
jgi:hypothetical protein